MGEMGLRKYEGTESDDKDKQVILVFGASGMIGSAIMDLLLEGGREVIGVSSVDCDLRDPVAVQRLLRVIAPTLVIHAAGVVGGISANLEMGLSFGVDNALITVNVLRAASDQQIPGLVYFGSSCCYPNDRRHRMMVSDLFTGEVESSSRAYALAKSLGIELVIQARKQGLFWTNVIPANVYGPKDNFHLNYAHVVAALMRRFHEAKVTEAERIVVRGSGVARRQFLHAFDLAEAVARVATELKVASPVINVAGDVETSIAELCSSMAKVVGYTGSIVWDDSSPDGTPVKLLDDTSIREMGWVPRYGLLAGLEQTYEWFTAASEAGEVRGYQA